MEMELSGSHPRTPKPVDTSSNSWNDPGEELCRLRACRILVNQIRPLHLLKAFNAAQHAQRIALSSSLYCSDKGCGDALGNDVAPGVIRP